MRTRCSGRLRVQQALQGRCRPPLLPQMLILCTISTGAPWMLQRRSRLQCRVCILQTPLAHLSTRMWKMRTDAMLWRLLWSAGTHTLAQQSWREGTSWQSTRRRRKGLQCCILPLSTGTRPCVTPFLRGMTSAASMIATTLASAP